jgi:hypothetical protein
VYKPSRTRVVADALLRLLNVIEPIDVPNETTNASLLYIEPKWLNGVKDFLRRGQIEGTLLIQQK